MNASKKRKIDAADIDPESDNSRAQDLPGKSSKHVTAADSNSRKPVHASLAVEGSSRNPTRSQTKGKGKERQATKSTTDKTPPVKLKRNIRKLVPPRPFPTVPTSVSATGPRSAHKEGKNLICITRQTPLSMYLRRCKDVFLKDGYATWCSLMLIRNTSDHVCVDTKHST